MRILGLDLGDRTIGVAVCDPLGYTAQGITTIRRKKEEADIEELKKLCTEYGVEKIVLGFPKNMNGTIGPQGEKAKAFGEKIKDILNLDIILWDERLTTVAATRAMLESNMSRSKRKIIVDKVAATFILQGYLDSIASK